MGNSMTKTLEVDPEIEAFLKQIEVLNFQGELEEPNSFEYKIFEESCCAFFMCSAFRARATLRFPAFPPNQKWQFGFMQGLLGNYTNKGIYEGKGYIYIQFRHHPLITDTVFNIASWYTHEIKNVSVDGDHYVLEISMEDQPNSTIPLDIPIKTSFDTNALTEFCRNNEFYTWLVAHEVYSSSFFALKCLHWGFLYYTDMHHKTIKKCKIFDYDIQRLTNGMLFPMMANHSYYKFWRFHYGKQRGSIITSPEIKEVFRF